jgi:hypothetical protein
MQAFCTSIIGRYIEDGVLVINAMQGSPVLRGCGNEFTIVADEDL